ncbi:hypothetical protein SUGI_0524400 [Cryptomeria japonica]|nr:hypothetical protein SUGI_0524400 [Cryptomeria japonica]
MRLFGFLVREGRIRTEQHDKRVWQSRSFLDLENTQLIVNVIMERNLSELVVRFQVAVVKLMVQGCDGSVLIDSREENTAEKDGPPNLSVHAFFVIDNAKTKLESACVATVCCADILALAAG